MDFKRFWLVFSMIRHFLSAGTKERLEKKDREKRGVLVNHVWS